jgi:para-aminobenzoate synthetase
LLDIVLLDPECSFPLQKHGASAYLKFQTGSSSTVEAINGLRGKFPVSYRQNLHVMDETGIYLSGPELARSLRAGRQNAAVACTLNTMKTLLIDNYDSFTFNLAQYIAEVNGEKPMVVKNDELSFDQLIQLPFDNVVISPGPGSPENPADFGVCGDVILRAPVPILGVCLGFQGIAFFHGCEVRRAPEPRHGQTSHISHDGSELFTGIPSPFQAVRYHSLHVPELRGPDLRETARSEDNLLMALKHVHKPIWGVQFHPESILTEHGRQLLRNFRDLSRRQNPRRMDSTRAAPRQPERPQENKTGKLPVRFQAVKGAPNAESIFAAIYSKRVPAVWLDSSMIGNDLSRFSFIADTSNPEDCLVRYRSRTRQLEVIRESGRETMNLSIFDFLRDAISSQPAASPDLPFEFCGGFIGYFGYEMKGECGGGYRHESDLPDAWFLRVSRFIAFDNQSSQCFVVAVGGGDDNARWICHTVRALQDIPELPSLDVRPADSHSDYSLEQSQTEYVRRIGIAMEHIRSGDSYEVCLTNRIRRPFEGDPFDLYRILRRRNPAPFSAFLNAGDFSVLGSSPERFLQIDPQGRIEARPMKGTITRSPDPAEDQRLAGLLRDSPKNRSENLMIVDLLRNDLGRVSRPGSVQVSSLMAIESYATVHQMVSTINAELSTSHDQIDGIRAAFPGGSMTGAPKIRTMDIIDTLESSPRGVYSGALGYLSFNGAVDLCISIRTMVAAGGQVTIGVGGAIVALSEPQQEFDEALLKGKALLAALAEYDA